MSVAFRSKASGRVFVTGLDGFTGRHLAPDLQAAGYTVCTYEPGAYDLTDCASVTRMLERMRPDFIIHLGGVSFVERGTVGDFYSVNTVGTSNLLEATFRAVPDVRAVILASSASIYGNPAVDLIEETTPPAPVNDYACSKLAMEFLARTWLDDLPIVITRPFNYTGVGQLSNFVVPKIVEHFASEAARIELGTLDVVRDFSDVRIASQAYCRLLDGGLAGEIYNICSGNGHSLRWILRQLSEISGHTIEVGISSALSRRVDVKRQVGSTVKLNSAVGPLASADFAQTLRWMYETRRAELEAAAS